MNEITFKRIETKYWSDTNTSIGIETIWINPFTSTVDFEWTSDSETHTHT